MSAASGQPCEEATIRILADGRVAFDGLPGRLLEIAGSVAPHDDGIGRRLEVYRRLAAQAAATASGEETTDGNAGSGARA